VNSTVPSRDLDHVNACRLQRGRVLKVRVEPVQSSHKTRDLLKPRVVPHDRFLVSHDPRRPIRSLFCDPALGFRCYIVRIRLLGESMGSAETDVTRCSEPSRHEINISGYNIVT
jgi:hypothetical protein